MRGKRRERDGEGGGGGETKTKKWKKKKIRGPKKIYILYYVLAWVLHNYGGQEDDDDDDYYGARDGVVGSKSNDGPA